MKSITTRLPKGQIILNILEKIAEPVEITTNILIAIATAGYGASCHKLQKTYEKQVSAQSLLKEEFARKNRTHRLLSYLQSQGLITQKRCRSNFQWQITKKGFQKLLNLKERLKKFLPNKDYPTETVPKLILVTFDIPEKKRRQRDWLRSVLKRLGFNFIQKSVWLGKKQVPLELMEDLEKMGMIEYVHILSIHKDGSIHKLLKLLT